MVDLDRHPGLLRRAGAGFEHHGTQEQSGYVQALGEPHGGRTAQHAPAEPVRAGRVAAQQQERGVGVEEHQPVVAPLGDLQQRRHGAQPQVEHHGLDHARAHPVQRQQPPGAVQPDAAAVQPGELGDLAGRAPVGEDQPGVGGRGGVGAERHGYRCVGWGGRGRVHWERHQPQPGHPQRGHRLLRGRGTGRARREQHQVVAFAVVPAGQQPAVGQRDQLGAQALEAAAGQRQRNGLGQGARGEPPALGVPAAVGAGGQAGGVRAVRGEGEAEPAQCGSGGTYRGVHAVGS